MERRRVILQLRAVETVVQVERRHGTLTPAILDRASQIVERTAIAIDGERDPELERQLAKVKRELVGG
jgi:hypothetical protein